MGFEVPGSDGRPVRAARHGPPDAPTVLVCHGFKGFKDWGSFPWICDRIAEAGLQAVRFDFSHNGVEESDFDRLDLFLLDTWSRHQEDLDALAAHLPGPLALVGHSRGGTDALLFAAREPRVRCVATLAAPSRVMVPADMEEVLRRFGYYPFENARTKQTMPVARTLADDLPRHSVEAAVRSLEAPVLLVHGTEDESVAVEHLDRLAAWSPTATVLRIEGAGHTFGAVHPFEGPTPHLAAVTSAVVPFLGAHLR